MRWKGATPRTDSATEAGFGDVFFRKMARQHGHGCKACPDEAAAEDTKHPPTPPCLREEQGDVCVKDFRWLMKRPLHAFKKITMRFLTDVGAPSNKLPRTALQIVTHLQKNSSTFPRNCNMLSKRYQDKFQKFSKCFYTDTCMFSHKFLHAFSKITLRFLTGIDAPSNKLPRTFLHVRTYRKRGTEGGRKKCRTSHQKVRRF